MKIFKYFLYFILYNILIIYTYKYEYEYEYDKVIKLLTSGLYGSAYA